LNQVGIRLYNSRHASPKNEKHPKSKRKAGIMSKGKSFQHSTLRIIALWYLSVSIAAGNSACTVLPTVISTPTPTQPPECPPPSYSVNVYNPTPVPAASTPIIATPQGQIFLSPKQLAFQNLVREVARWTNMVTIDAGGTSQARITITFLSPELLRAVSIIDMLDENPGNPYIYSDAARQLTEIARREKLIFFLTIHPVKTAADQPVNPHTLNLIAEQLFLVNANGLLIAPASYDHNLDQLITLPEQHVAGYLYYPLSVSTNRGCVEVLSSAFDTKIVLQIPSVTIDKVKNGPHTWTIQYKYLLNTGGSSTGSAEQHVPPDSDIKVMDNPPDSLDTSDAFWEQYAKFLWGKLTPKH